MSIVQDLRHAWRLMMRQKRFTAVALVTLALGIGANTAIFSLVYGVLLRPLPYPTADRIVRVGESHQGGTPIIALPMVSNATFHAWRRSSRTIERIGSYRGASFTVIDRESTSRVIASSVTPGIFEMLGARPQAGRLLQDADLLPGAAQVVVLSAPFWQERYGGNESVVDRSIVLDGQPHTIVGVASPDFYFPDRTARLWVPYVVPDTPASQRLSIASTLALLRPDATPEQAAAEATAAARSVGPRHLSANLLFGKGGAPQVSARPLLEEMTSTVRPALLVLLASVALVLLIACANVANLLLSRGVTRRREMAVRAAIGAGSRQIARQVIVETLALSVAGGVLGVALGAALIRLIPVLAPETFPRVGDVRMDVMAFAFAAAASLVAGLLAGALPALRAARGDLLPALREGSGASASAHARQLGAGLLTAEVAVAIVLIVGAGLLGRSFVRLLAVEPGYDAANVLMARVYIESQAAASNREEMFAQALLDRVRAMPGVLAAGMSGMAPFVGMTAVMQATLTGDSAEPINARALSHVITPGYAEALSMRVREGRLFEAHDVTAGIRPILVNEEFARLHVRDGRPVAGRRFKASFSRDRMVEIVGVVGNVLKDGLDTQPQAEIYNLATDGFGLPPAMNLAIRTAGDPVGLVPALAAALRGIDRTAAMDEVETLGSRVSASVSQPRFALLVLAAFAGVALTLASIGLYGVLSYQVQQRRREIGIRAALGASRGAIVRLIVREGLAVTAAGIVVGLLGAAWLARLLQGLLFGVTPYDAVTFGVAPLAVVAVSVVAMLVPARRAASTDPIEALRTE
jgi:putative ABC transport system permease protein